MKTIIARFTELKNNVSAADSEFEDLDYNKVDKALKSVGISLKDSIGLFRNLDDVFLELSLKWDTLDRNAQRYIATTAAGSRQQSRFLAMMENYDRTLELIETALTSVGRSNEQFAKYQDTIESKIKRLKTSWEKLRVSMLDPNKYKGAIEALTKIVEKLNKMDIKQIAAIGVTFATVGKTLVTNLIKSIQGSTTAISNALNLPFDTSYRRVSSIVVNGVKTTVSLIKKDFVDLNNDIILVVGKSGQEISTGLLNRLSALTPSGRELAMLYADGARHLLTQNDKVLELKKKLVELGKTEDEITAEMANLTTELGKQLKKLEEMQAQLLSRGNSLKGLGLNDDDLNVLALGGVLSRKLTELLSGIFLGTGKELKTAFSGFISTTLSSALMGAVTTLASGGSFEDALKNTLKTTLITAIPQAISSIASVLVPKLITVFTTTILGPVAIGVGALIGGILLRSYIDNNGGLKAALKVHKLAEQEFEKAKEKYTAIKLMVDEDEKQVKELNEKVKNLDELIERYKELSKINNLTTEEQEEYNELINNLKDELPELKEFYDERNNKLTISNAKLDEMLKKEKEIAKLKTAVYYADLISETQAQRRVLRSENKEAYTALDERLETRRKELNKESNEEHQDWLLLKVSELMSGDKNLDFFSAQLLAGVEWEKHLDELIRQERETELLKIDEDFNKSMKESAEKLAKLVDDAIDAEFSEESPFYRNFLKKNVKDLNDFYDNAYTELIESASLEGELQNLLNSSFTGLGSDLALKIIDIQGSKDAALQWFETFKATYTGEAELFTTTMLEELANLLALLDLLKEMTALDASIPDDLKNKFNKDIDNLMSKIPEDFNKAIEAMDWGKLNSEKNNVIAEYYNERNKLAQLGGINFLTKQKLVYGKNGLKNEQGSEIFSQEELEKLTNDELLSLNNFAEDKIQKLGRDVAHKYLQSLSNAMDEEKLSVSLQTQIMNFLDWDLMDASNLNDWKEKFFNFYQSNIDEAASRTNVNSLFDKLLEGAKNTGLYEPLIKDFEAYEKTIKEGYEELEKNAGLMKAIALKGEDALVDQSALDKFQDLLDKMYEAGNLSKEHSVNEFFTWDAEKGAYTVSNAERLEKVWDKMSKSKLKDIANDALAGFDESVKDMPNKFTDAKDALKKLSKEGEINEKEWASIKKYCTETGSSFYDLLKNTQKWDKSLKNAQDTTKEIAEKIKEARGSIDSLISSVSSAAGDMLEKGKIDYSGLTSLSSTMEKLAENDENFTLSLSNYYDKLNQTFNYKKWIVDMRAYLQMRIKLHGQNAEDIALLAELNAMEQELIDKEAELAKQEEETTEAIEEENEALEKQKELEQEVANAEKELETAQNSLADALKKVADAYDEIVEKEKAVLEILEELNEAMYGTGDRRKSTLDGMYNYEQLLKDLSNTISDVKSKLTDYESTDITGDVQSYGASMRNKKIMLLSQLQAYQNSLSTAKNLLSEYSSYYTEINGRLLVDVAKLNSAAMPDKIKDLIESTINAYNNSVDKIHDITNEIKSLEKEFVDFLKTYRDKYINLLEKVIATLKLQALEELNTQKEKYSALEEADNDYTNALEEAINKQRELRDRANEENDLALKEKKLSLMQRDTSGANLKDILKLQEDVDKTRLSLNDKKIDSIVKSLKELYKTLKQSRDAEIKYRETVLQNATFIEEANAVISSWQTADELVAWFMEHSAEVETMTLELLEVYSEELALMYTDREIYMTTSMEDFMNMLNVSQSEINNMSASVSETLSTEMERMFKQVRDEVDKTILGLIDKLEEAKIAVDTAKTNLKTALTEVATAIKDVQEKTLALATARLNLADATLAAAAAEKELEKTSEAKENSGGSSGNSSGNNSGGNANNTSASPQKISEEDSDAKKYSGYSAYKTLSASEKTLMNSIANNIAKNGKADIGTDAVKHKNELLSMIYEVLKDKHEISGYWYGLSSGAYHFGTSESDVKDYDFHQYYFKRYAKGGLVNYTGPAWVDGSPASPEAFLSAEDTKNIVTFTNALSSLLSLTPFKQNQSVDNSTTTTINVTVNVDSISDDYDVHNAVQKVKDEIVAAAQRVGSTVILHQ